jgi:hypothetical protein
MIGAGMLPTDGATEEALRRIPVRVYHTFRSKRMSSFAFISDLKLPEVLAFVRAVAVAERATLCPYPGSTSLLIPAFDACQGRPKEEVAAVADWLVANHDNPYTPFNSRTKRDLWETARQSSSSPIETLHLVGEMEASVARAKLVRAKRHEIRAAITRLKRGEAPSSPNAREQIVSEMEREILEP